MTERENTKVDGRTKRALDTAIAKRQVSQESYRAVLEGRIDLKTAKDLGREGSPFGPVVRADKNDRSRPCLCGCGRTTKSIFAQGHDMRMVTLAKAHVRGEAELTEEQLEYVEESGKLERAKVRVGEEDRKRREREAKAAARKATKAAKKS